MQDSKTSIDVGPTAPTPPSKNRKTRRTEKSLATHSAKPAKDPYYWHKRILVEMKDNPQVQQDVLTGKYDYFLNTKENT